MFEINCNSVNQNDGNVVPVSFSFPNGMSENGIEITPDNNRENTLYFGVEELLLIIETLKKEADRRSLELNNN